MATEKKEKDKPAYSKFIIALCIITIIAFTVTCMVFYWNGKSVDPTLILCFFACFGFEFGSLAFIKGRELRYVQGDGKGKVPHVEPVEEDDDKKERKDESEQVRQP